MDLKIGDEIKMGFEIENLKVNIILNQGFFDLDKENKIHLHSHNSFEFHLIMNGSAKVSTEAEIYTLSKGEACLISPHTVHNCVLRNEKTIKTSFAFSISKNSRRTGEDMYSLFSGAFNTFSGVMKIEDTYKYTENIEKILAEFYSDNRFKISKVKSYFFILLMNMAEELIGKGDASELIEYENKSESSDLDLRRIIIEEYINMNYNKDITLEDISKVLHLCSKQTERIIKREFGMSFKDIVLKIRCDTAIYLLKNTDIPVSDIAFRVGYHTYNGFYNMFCSKKGISPEKYRKMNKKQKYLL